MTEHFLSPKSMAELTRTLGDSLGYFSPELVLCAGIVLLLVLRLFNSLNRVHMGYVALVLTLVSLFLAWAQWQPFLDSKETIKPIDYFQGMLVFDGLAVFLKILLLAG